MDKNAFGCVVGKVIDDGRPRACFLTVCWRARAIRSGLDVFQGVGRNGRISHINQYNYFGLSIIVVVTIQTWLHVR